MFTDLEKNIIWVWAVYEVHDEYGRHRNLRTVCRTEAEGKIAANGLGWYGGQGDCDKKAAIIDPESGLVYLLVTSTGQEFADVTKRKEELKQIAKEAALAKLTPEERELLGL